MIRVIFSIVFLICCFNNAFCSQEKSNARSCNELKWEDSKGFELGIASKCRLLSVVDESLKAYVDAMNALKVAYNEANSSGKALSKNEIDKIISSEELEYIKRALESQQDDLKVHLNGLKNNPHIGSTAKEMLILAEKNHSIFNKAGELYIELLSDIEIATSMGLSTGQYKSKMDLFMLHWLAFEILKGPNI